MYETLHLYASFRDVLYRMKCFLFAYGFRSHFFLAGVAALLLVPLWAMSFVAGTPAGSGWPPTLWHGHEMLFGFIASAIAGVHADGRSQLDRPKGICRPPADALALVWLSGRLLIHLLVAALTSR